MTAGRNPLPTKIKQLQGTARADRVLENEVEYTLVEKVPRPPKEWPAMVRKIWRNVCKQLISKGLLFETDLPAVQAYCFACYQQTLAQAQLLNPDGGFVVKHRSVTGVVNNVVSPWLKVMESSQRVIDRFGAKFGFSPADKTKIAVPNAKKVFDPFTEI